MRHRSVFVAAGLLALGSASCRRAGDDKGKTPGLSLARWLGNDVPPPAGAASASPPSAPVPLVEPLATLVALNGQARPLQATQEGAPRVFARAAKTWIYERPSEESPHIGYLRAGAAVSISTEVVGKSGCPGGFHAIVPRGFVCVGANATLDVADPVVAALGSRGPQPGRKLPYIYGTVRKPGPVYARLPTEGEIARVEPGIERRMERWLTADGEVGANYAQFVWLGRPGEVPDPRAVWHERRTDALPGFLANGGAAPNLHQKPRDPGQLVVGHTRAKMGFSFTDTFLWQGRRYGVTPELEILPTDRLRPIQGSEFHGVELGQGVTLPLALVRQPGARYVIYERAGNRLVPGDTAPYREAVPLTGRQQFFHDVLHYETKDGRWLSDRDASRLDPAKKQPGWAVKGERWIDVNITKQSLVLYQGTTPVYATLISSGEAGLGDSEQTTATKRGIFRVHAKHVATTMSSDEVGEEFELRDVPYVQYFDDDGHAIHGAYWHDKFGIPKSHGCINLAPEDARRIFYWTDPPVPDGWHGASDALTGTVIFIHP
jgi:lipoprotein-anchoring transpeptidase ErfK/SrfK